MSFTTHNASMRIQAVAAILEGRPMKTLTMGRFFSRQFVYTMYNICIYIYMYNYITIHIYTYLGQNWVPPRLGGSLRKLTSTCVDELIWNFDCAQQCNKMVDPKHKIETQTQSSWPQRLVGLFQPTKWNTNCLTLKMTLAPNWTPTWSCINMYNSILNQVNTHQSSFIRTFPTSGPQKGEVILRYR